MIDMENRISGLLGIMGLGQEGRCCGLERVAGGILVINLFCVLTVVVVTGICHM